MAVLEEMNDKRRAPRHETRASLIYFPFSSRKVSSRAAHVLDCSPGGISFLASRSLKPGQTICLHTPSTPDPDPSAHRAGAMLKSFSLAEVRWCVKAGGGREGYRIGVRYLQPQGPADAQAPL